MPTKSLTACSYPGCGVSCIDGRCSKHKRTTWNKVHDDYYDSQEWKTLRARVLKRDALCRVCGKRKSKTVDHVLARRDGGSNTMRNLQGACWPCHNRKTRYEQMLRAGKEVKVSIKKQAVQPIWDEE